LLDVGILAAHLAARSAPTDPTAPDDALAILAEAEAAFGPSGVLCLERAAHAAALGRRELAAESAKQAERFPPRSAWEHLAVGRAYLGAGDVPRAAAELDRSLALDPASLWANYHRGACALKLGDPAGALAAFSACLALAPESGWCWYNRGLANADAGRPDRARADFDRAIGFDPTLTAAREARQRLRER
jgi:tetratricopeptide (TPR) repeat protein